MIDLMFKFDVLGILISFCLICVFVVLAIVCGFFVIVSIVTAIRCLIDFFKKGDDNK